MVTVNGVKVTISIYLMLAPTSVSISKGEYLSLAAHARCKSLPIAVCTIFLFGGTEMELKIEYLPIKALKPYEKNTRKHQKKDVDNIARSIERYGMCDAIGIWGEQNIIVEGHGRMLACKQLGMTEVPCVRLDHLTDEQRREYAIAHNATAELSEWDLDILPDELAELDLSDFDFDFGIDDEEEDFDENDLERDDEKDGCVLIQITFRNLQEYKNAENAIKDIIGDATMTVKMV